MDPQYIKGMQQEVDNIFKEFDRNHSGLLEPEEVAAFKAAYIVKLGNDKEAHTTMAGLIDQTAAAGQGSISKPALLEMQKIIFTQYH